MPSCNSCGADFPDFRELAKHIVERRTTHQRGLKWAFGFLSNVEYLDAKVNRQKSFENRAPLTEEDREKKEQSQRELSGRSQIATVICPHCKNRRMEDLPEEFVYSSTAWKIKGKLVVSCDSCAEKSRPKFRYNVQ